MPITKSAKKAAKQSEKRRLTNSKFKVKLKNTLKKGSIKNLR
jgi:ribosomal protein S20